MILLDNIANEIAAEQAAKPNQAPPQTPEQRAAIDAAVLRQQQYMHGDVPSNVVFSTGSQNPSLSSIPRDAEWYEYNGNFTKTHAAGPNTLAFDPAIALYSLVSISDELVRVFDKVVYRFAIQSNQDAYYTQMVHFLTCKGPSTATISSVDNNPASGYRAAVDASVSGGTEVKWLAERILKPQFDGNGHVQTITWIDIDLTKHMNAFVNESEKALSQGRSQPKFYLAVLVNGVAGKLTTFFYTRVLAYHTRTRKIVA